MHWPKRPLAGGGLGGFGRQLSPRVHVGEGKVAPYVANVAEVGEQLPDDRFCLTAVGAFEVAVLDHSDQCFSWTADVVAIRIDRLGQVDDGLRGAQQGSHSPPWWEQRSDA